jgi:putative membrane protein
MTALMFWMMIAAAGLASIIHVLFFLMESVFWSRPAVMRIFHRKESDTVSTRMLAFNQGFYNLFLAAGVLVGFALIAGGRTEAGLAVVAANCAVMFGASIVLLVSSPRMLRGALIQGLAPLAFLALLLF